MDKEVRVAIIGVGNCASSLVQGVYYYKNADPDQFIPGIMHTVLGGIHIGNIKFVAAFDVDENKVGKDLSEAIYAPPNNTYVFHKVPKIGAKVYKGKVIDSIGKYLKDVIKISSEEEIDVVKVLKDTGAEVVVNFLPVGSEETTKWYAERAMEAGCAFVNAIPVFIASNPEWANKFKEAGLPVIGDDIKSQVGATIVHRTLTQLYIDRGVKLERTFQLNFGGNTDFLNMLEKERLKSKKISKTGAVTSLLPYNLGEENVHIGPSDYVPWLKDRKWAYIRLEGRTFGDVPLNIELKLEVWDSPNAAGIIVDAVRLAKLALVHKVAGPLVEASAYLMKTPPKQVPDYKARQLLEEWIEKHSLDK